MRLLTPLPVSRASQHLSFTIGSLDGESLAQLPQPTEAHGCESMSAHFATLHTLPAYTFERVASPAAIELMKANGGVAVDGKRSFVPPARAAFRPSTRGVMAFATGLAVGMLSIAAVLTRLRRVKP